MEKQQPLRPPFKKLDTQPPVTPRVEGLFGLFRSQDAVPTRPARKLDEQVRIVGGVLYIYDRDNDSWIRVGPFTYAGRVASNAAATPFPTGWSLNHSATGTYVVTHNFGTSDYAAVAIPAGAYITAITINNNSFTITFRDTAGTLQDSNFSFIVSK